MIFRCVEGRTPSECAALYGIGELAADRHDFTFPMRKQSRRADVRLHHRQLRTGEWILLRGLLVTRPARIASDLLRENEDPEAVAQLTADAIRALSRAGETNLVLSAVFGVSTALISNVVLGKNWQDYGVSP